MVPRPRGESLDNSDTRLLSTFLQRVSERCEHLQTATGILMQSIRQTLLADVAFVLALLRSRSRCLMCRWEHEDSQVQTMNKRRWWHLVRRLYNRLHAYNLFHMTIRCLPQGSLDISISLSSYTTYSLRLVLLTLSGIYPPLQFPHNRLPRLAHDAHQASSSTCWMLLVSSPTRIDLSCEVRDSSSIEAWLRDRTGSKHRWDLLRGDDNR